MEQFEWIAEAAQAGQRIDRCLAEEDTGLSRSALQALLEKWPKLRKVQTLRVRNNYLFALLLRAVGFLPADPLGMYFGASGMPYGPCMLGCVSGMLPVIAVTTVMGGSIEQPGSLAFILSASLFAAIEIGAVIAFAVWAKKK